MLMGKLIIPQMVLMLLLFILSNCNAFALGRWPEIEFPIETVSLPSVAGILVLLVNDPVSPVVWKVLLDLKIGLHLPAEVVSLDPGM